MAPRNPRMMILESERLKTFNNWVYKNEPRVACTAEKVSAFKVLIYHVFLLLCDQLFTDGKSRVLYDFRRRARNCEMFRMYETARRLGKER